MQKYGIIQDGELLFVDADFPGAKPVAYAPVPDFDQCSQAVFQSAPIEQDDYIFVDVEVADIEQDDTSPGDMFDGT